MRCGFGRSNLSARDIGVSLIKEVEFLIISPSHKQCNVVENYFVITCRISQKIDSSDSSDLKGYWDNHLPY